MKDKVRIKSFSKGLSIQLDESAPFEELLSEITSKFREGKNFFGNASVAITFQGRTLSEDEENDILDSIEKSCELKVICVIAKDELQDNLFDRALQHSERKRLAQADIDREVQIFHGSLKDGEELSTPNSVIILGDVECGCSIRSEKSVFVLGALYGKVHAGMGRQHENSIVAALEMTPEELLIGDFKYIPPKMTRWGKKKGSIPQVAKVHKNSILMEELTKEHLKDF